MSEGERRSRSSPTFGAGPWSSIEDDLLRELYPVYGSEAARVLSALGYRRSVEAVRVRAKVMGLKISEREHITGTGRKLLMLLEREGPLETAEVVRTMRMTRQALHKALHQLRRMGLVNLERQVKFGVPNAWSITEEGAKRIAPLQVARKLERERGEA